MKENGNLNDIEKKTKNTSPHRRALRDFLKQTNDDPSFFDLSPEEQKKVARGHIDRQKALPIQINEAKREAKE